MYVSCRPPKLSLRFRLSMNSFLTSASASALALTFLFHGFEFFLSLFLKHFEKHVVYRSACWNHRVNLLLPVDNKVHEHRFLYLECLFENGFDFTGFGGPQSHCAISMGQFNEVGCHVQIGVRVTFLEEEFLPLSHHSKITVFKDRNLYRQFIDYRCSQFLNIHLNASIAGDINYESVRKCKLCSDCSRQSVTHRAEASRGQQAPGLVELVKLRRPHLVLPDLCCDNGISLCEFINFLHYKLRFDDIFIETVSERSFPFPKGYLLQPRLSDFMPRFLNVFFKQFVQDSQDILDVADNRYVNSHVLSDRGGVYINMNDPGMRSKTVYIPGYTIIESHTDGNQQVGLL